MKKDIKMYFQLFSIERLGTWNKSTYTYINILPEIYLSLFSTYEKSYNKFTVLIISLTRFNFNNFNFLVASFREN